MDGGGSGKGRLGGGEEKRGCGVEPYRRRRGPRVPQERSAGESGPDPYRAQVEHAKALRARLVARFGADRIREYGSRGHAVGHARRVGYEPASVPMPWDWVVK